ncbi:unnamed protein product [Triticum turgidum subsp. durum]|uniref:Uncharacterized protein n=1 Tax=Triticum turgidum subsp. durum TaxID=4567 RepID=A0A9R0WH29_TRITD|nr:unnamed protein product [Triticum turgidum subsp. durum]
MWGCYVNSLKALSSLQATVTNFAANFISSGFSMMKQFKFMVEADIHPSLARYVLISHRHCCTRCVSMCL